MLTMAMKQSWTWKYGPARGGITWKDVRRDPQVHRPGHARITIWGKTEVALAYTITATKIGLEIVPRKGASGMVNQCGKSNGPS